MAEKPMTEKEIAYWSEMKKFIIKNKESENITEETSLEEVKKYVENNVNHAKMEAKVNNLLLTVPNSAAILGLKVVRPFVDPKGFYTDMRDNTAFGRTFGLSKTDRPGLWGMFRNSIIGRTFGLADKTNTKPGIWGTIKGWFGYGNQETSEQPKGTWTWLRNSFIGRSIGLADKDNTKLGLWGKFRNSLIGRTFGLEDEKNKNKPGLYGALNFFGHSPIIRTENTPSAVKRLIDQGVDLTAWESKLTLFRSHNPETIKLLLENGTNVNCRDDYIFGAENSTPLHENNTNPEIVKMFLDAGADVFAKNNRGKTPKECLLERMSLSFYENNPDEAAPLKESLKLIEEAEKRQSQKLTQTIGNNAQKVASDSADNPALVYSAARENS